uniref:Uncharacterized protein n=1 Tax=Meloidogyne javanica TaxID=6303 RepID=A0A915MK46_MELJA
MSNSSTLISSKGKENNDTKDIEIIDIDKANNGNNDKVDDICKSLWKLVRMKYIPRLEFRLCRTCSNILFHSTSRIVEAEDGGANFSTNFSISNMAPYPPNYPLDWVLQVDELDMENSLANDITATYATLQNVTLLSEDDETNLGQMLDYAMSSQFQPQMENLNTSS